MAGLSGYFTQDLEDMDGATKSPAKTTQNAKTAPKASRTNNNTDAEKEPPVQVVNEDTGEIIDEDGMTGWDDLISDSELYCEYCGEQVSEKVRKYSREKFGKTICYKCQQAQKAAAK